MHGHLPSGLCKTHSVFLEGLRVFKRLCLFITYFWLCGVFLAVVGFPLVLRRGGYPLVAVHSFSSWWLFFSQSLGSRAHGPQKLRLRGSVSQQLLASNLSRGQSCDPSIGRQMLNLWIPTGV